MSLEMMLAVRQPLGPLRDRIHTPTEANAEIIDAVEVIKSPPKPKPQADWVSSSRRCAEWVRLATPGSVSS